MRSSRSAGEVAEPQLRSATIATRGAGRPCPAQPLVVQFPAKSSGTRHVSDCCHAQISAPWICVGRGKAALGWGSPANLDVMGQPSVEPAQACVAGLHQLSSVPTASRCHDCGGVGAFGPPNNAGFHRLMSSGVVSAPPGHTYSGAQAELMML